MGGRGAAAASQPMYVKIMCSTAAVPKTSVELFIEPGIYLYPCKADIYIHIFQDGRVCVLQMV